MADGMDLTPNTALVLIDVQQGFDLPRWGRRNNLGAEERIAGLLEAWRKAGWPVFHVQHDSQSPDGTFQPGTAPHDFKPEARPIDGEPVYRKKVNSGFIGTSLEADLRRQGIETLVIAGLTTQHCVSTTTRMAGNLGFRVFLVSDATVAFEQVGIDGQIREPEAVHYGALSDLSEEFATIVEADAVLRAMPGAGLGSVPSALPEALARAR